MAIYTSRISPKGQITLPKHVRDRLHLKTKDRVNIELEDGKIIVTAAEDKLAAGFMSIPALKKPLSDREMTKLVEEEVAQDFARRGV